MPGHDIITIGASAGGLEALRRLVTTLPADLPAAVFVVLHILPYSRSSLPELLSKMGRLPASHPEDRQPYQHGVVYVAPPNHHLLVGDGFVRVVQGPKENNARPAIDPLFRTAAVSHGPRTVGVVLSGLMDDGTAGLAAVKTCGGVAVIQDPQDALYPEMPTSARQNVAVDHCLPMESMGPLLERLAHEPAPPSRPVLRELQLEAALAEWDLDALKGTERPGRPSQFTCPNCKGDLWEMGNGPNLRFRCRTGHAWSPLALLTGMSENLDTVLNEAFRALKEKIDLTRRLARQAQSTGSVAGVKHYEREIDQLERYSRVIWEMLQHIKTISAPESPPSVETDVQVPPGTPENKSKPLSPRKPGPNGEEQARR